MLVTLKTWILSTGSQSFHGDKQALEGYGGQPGQRGEGMGMEAGDKWVISGPESSHICFV